MCFTARTRPTPSFPHSIPRDTVLVLADPGASPLPSRVCLETVGLFVDDSEYIELRVIDGTPAYPTNRRMSFTTDIFGTYIPEPATPRA